MLVRLTPEIARDWHLSTVKIIESMNDLESGNYNLVSVETAMRLATENCLDAVLIEKKNGMHPVVMIAEFQKVKYIQEKQAKQNAVKAQQTKEVDFGIHIAEADYQQKLKKIKQFIDEGDKVSFIVTLRGRETYLANGNGSNKGSHIDEFIARLAEDLMKIGFILKKPTRNGRNITGILVPFRKK